MNANFPIYSTLCKQFAGRKKRESAKCLSKLTSYDKSALIFHYYIALQMNQLICMNALHRNNLPSRVIKEIRGV